MKKCNENAGDGRNNRPLCWLLIIYLFFFSKFPINFCKMHNIFIREHVLEELVVNLVAQLIEIIN